VLSSAWWLIGLARPAWWWWLGLGNAGVVVVAWGVGLRLKVGNTGVVVDWLARPAWWWWLGLADLGVVVAWACRSCGSRPGFADLGLGLPSLFLLSSGVRYIITSFSFSLFSSKSCEFHIWLLSGGLVCDGGLVAVWWFGL
jgi:hypothetical protein